MNKDWISFTFTDNEEDNADDIQLKTHDRDLTWMRKYIAGYVDDQTEAGEVISTPEEAEEQSGRVQSGSSSSGNSVYKVTSPQGLNVRTGAGENYKILGKLFYGDYIKVSKFQSGWACITYSGQTAYVKSGTLVAAGSSASSSSSSSGSSASGSSQSSASTINKGVKMSATIVLKNDKGDGKDSVLDCGMFELDSIDLQGPPTSLTIKGTSLSYSSAVRQTLKSKSWENTTLSEIAKAIASANGIAVMFESKSDPKYTRAEQYKTSDISFLQKLCHDAGCSLKATNNILVIFDQAEFEDKDTVRTIEFGESGGYSKYKLSTSEDNCYTSCRVYYTDSSGTVISATEYSTEYREGSENQQCLEVRQKVSSIAEAQQLAHKLLRLHNKYESEVSFTFPGDPTLVAGMGIALEGFGFWDGNYIVKQAKHTVSQSGYTTQISLRKALNDNEQAVGSGESATGASDSELEEIAMQVIRGDWGNGADRKSRLTEAGYDYSAVQSLVNKILGV